MAGSRIKNRLKDKSVLVTGAGGFLGRYLVPQLLSAGFFVSCYAKDVRQIDSLHKRYDIICHLAGFTKTGPGVSAAMLYEANVEGTSAVMRYCQKSGSRCIFASSSAVYRRRLTAGRLSERSQLMPESLYGVSKFAAENTCRRFADDYGVDITALRIFNMYGAGQKFPFLIPYILRQISGKRQVVLNTPDAVRDFVHVSDVSRAFVASCIHRLRGFNPINIATGRGLSVCALTKKIFFCFGLKPEIKTGIRAGQKGDFSCADIQRAAKLIRWQPMVSIDAGILEIIKAE